MKITVLKSAYYGFAILVLIPVVFVALYALLARPAVLGLNSIPEVLLLGVCFALFHAFGQWVHQVGHALAARATGHPMTGMRYDWVFTYSEYPPNEPPLPDRVHIQRSLGGPVAVTLLLVVVVVLWAQPAEGFTRWLLNFMLFDSVLLFIASAILSDGVLFIRQRAWEPKG